MGTHTPGPWLMGIEPTLNTIRIRDSGLDALPIATIFYSDGGRPRYQRPEAEANARLIAAAPELLEALAYYVGLHERHRLAMPEGNENEGKEWARTLTFARAAIAKATT